MKHIGGVSMSISPPVFPPNNFVPFTFTPNIQYGEVDDIPLLLDLFCPFPIPVEPLPAVVYIHGGGWDGGQRSGGMAPWLCPLLATQGFLAVTISYRLSYQAIFPAQIHDVKAAVRWLRANAEHYHLHPERIGVWGFSAGGHLAALAGVTGDLPSLEGTSGSAIPRRYQWICWILQQGPGCGRGGGPQRFLLSRWANGRLKRSEASLWWHHPATGGSRPSCQPSGLRHRSGTSFPPDSWNP
jgi:hypothetical protein